MGEPRIFPLSIQSILVERIDKFMRLVLLVLASITSFPFDTVVKLDTVNKSVTTTSVGNHHYIDEPIFVPEGVKEDDGYLL